MNSNPFPTVGVCSWSLWQELPEQLDFLANNGFTSTSLLQHIIKADPGMKREAAAVIREKNLVLTFHSNVLKAHLPDGRNIDRDYIARLYDEVLWWHENTNGIFSSCSDANIRSACIEHLNYMRQRLEPVKIRYGLENTCWIGPDKYFCSSQEMHDVYNAQDQKTPLCGILLDAGHANVCCTRYNIPFEDYIAGLPGPVWEVHICDNFGKQDDHLPLGDGTLDLKRLFRVLKQHEFNGVFTYESLRKRDRQAFDLHEPCDVESLLDYKDRILNTWREVTLES